jgi:hypothetical protein
MEHHLAGWKRLYLSKGSRLTLIKKKKKNSPSNFCTYSLSLFPMHVGMAKRLEKLGDFLWGGIGDKFKPHLFKWLRI